MMTIIAGIFFALGGVAVLIGALGLIRLPDVYSRIHAAGIIDTAGVACFILGMVCLSGASLVTVKLLLIGIFLIFTSPISGHAIAQVAKSQGIMPEGRDLTTAAKNTSKSKPTTGKTTRSSS
ncbi:MAG: monovalent cation/H(+) antiporter subunit G [Alphaproteobacteria bacterium]|nr:monovalent cation/H(+) antiporter subunit G [Alphaproteobacteria bacterium]